MKTLTNKTITLIRKVVNDDMSLGEAATLFGSIMGITVLVIDVLQAVFSK